MRGALFTAVVFICSIHAETAIVGTVRDPQGKPVSGAAVRLTESGGHRVAVTGADGMYRFPRVLTAAPVITVEAESFERAVRSISPDGKETTADFELPLRALPQQVTVTASGFAENLEDSARSVSVVSREELDQRGEYSVGEALREVPGVRLTQLGGPGSLMNIRLRGLRGQDTSVLIDGMRLRDPSSTQGDATAFAADLMTVNIARLEVLRGCGSSLYGSNAMGGVVNVVSDPGGGRFRADWLGEGGGLGFFRSQLRMAGSALKERLAYSTGLAHVNVSEGVDGDDAYRNSSAQGYLQYRLRDTFLLTARVSSNNGFAAINGSPSLSANAPRSGAVVATPLAEDQQTLRGRGLPFALGSATVLPAPTDPDSSRTVWFTSALFAADHQINSRLNYRVAYQLVESRREFPNGPGGIGFQPRIRDVTNFDASINTAQARLNYSSLRHIASVGYEFEREAFRNRGFTAALRPAPDSTYGANVSQDSHAIFGEERWRLLASRLEVTLSGRIATFDLRRPTLTGGAPVYLSAPVPSPPRALTGDAAVMYRVFNRTKIRGHFGNSYRAPSLYERYGTGFFGGVFTPYGDPRLKPERSVGMDAGIDQYFGVRRARISATYFYTQLDSVIGFDFSGLINRTTDPFGRGSGYFNTNGGLARGVEVDGQIALWRGFLLSSSYTHTRTLERRPVAAGTLLTPRIFPHTFSANATQTWKRLLLTASFLGSSEYFGVISGRAVRWPGPRRLDASASYRLLNAERLKSDLYVRGENILNQLYYEDGFRVPRAWGTAGIRLTF